MKLVQDNFFFLFTLVIIGIQLFILCAESSTVNIDSDALDFNKRYRFDKKDVAASVDSSDAHELEVAAAAAALATVDDDDRSQLMNKRYRFDKRYRYDRKRSNVGGLLNKRYRFDKRYRYD